jgi:hypothetical protein
MLLFTIVLKNGGTVTWHIDEVSGMPSVDTMSAGPAFDALLESAEQAHERLHGSRRMPLTLSPKMASVLIELREKHGDTLTRELSSAINSMQSDLFKKVRIGGHAMNIVPGKPLSLFFEDERSKPFYGDQIHDVERQF